MTDTTEIQSGVPAELTRTHNKNLIFAALAEAGIHRVTVDYDSSGDSGQIARDLEVGHAVVLQVVSTNEALLDRRLAEIPTSEWADLSIDITHRDMCSTI
jgi:hypothetical protein